MGVDKLISEILNVLSINASGIVLFIIFLMSIIQIAPIKLNPWSWIANKISSGIIGTMSESMEKIEEDIKCLKADVKNMKKDINQMNNEILDVRNKIEEQAAITARVRILRMNDELLRATKHTKENFDHCLNDITLYDEYCKEHPKFKDSMTALATENIKNVYRECLRKHSFLSYSKNDIINNYEE